MVTETDSALREGSYVKGTVLLVLRKRQGSHKTTRDDLAWEIQEEVEKQVAALKAAHMHQLHQLQQQNALEADAEEVAAGSS